MGRSILPSSTKSFHDSSRNFGERVGFAHLYILERYLMKVFPSHPKCQYCRMPIPRKEYTGHMVICPSRPERIVDMCAYCGKGIMTKRKTYSLRICAECKQTVKGGKGKVVQGGLPTLGKKR